MGVLWKDWCWSWNSSTLTTSCEDLTHWKRLWCWEGLGAGGEGDDRGWDGWMVHRFYGREFEWTSGDGNDREAWRAVIHGVAKTRTRLSDWTELNWTNLRVKLIQDHSKNKNLKSSLQKIKVFWEMTEPKSHQYNVLHIIRKTKI